jgi:uncharacterized Zn ribbon protein
MGKLILLTMVLGVFVATNVSADPRSCACFGGQDAEGNWWYLDDYDGNPLNNGDYVYAAWTGPDGQIDPPVTAKEGGKGIGECSDDDVRLRAGAIYWGGFTIAVTIFDPPRHPHIGDLIYCRIFDADSASLTIANYYGDSDLHSCTHELGERFFASFPGDPGGGHTDTPLLTGLYKDFTIYGGLDTTDMSYWPLTDIDGQRLQDNDLVQLIWTGPDTLVDSMDSLSGMPTGDDNLLNTWGVGHGYGGIETGLFKYKTFTFEENPAEGFAAKGDHVYLRVFNHNAVGEGSGSKWYGESPRYEVQFEVNEEFYSFQDSLLDAIVQVPWYRTITIYGGTDTAMVEHPITDSSGVILEDGDLVQLIWAGPDGDADPLNEASCLPTGDDSLLISLAIGTGYGAGTGLFKVELQTFSKHEYGFPAQGDVLYMRVFNDSISYQATHYGESENYVVTYQQGEVFFSFPDDADDAIIPNPCFITSKDFTVIGGLDTTDMSFWPLVDAKGVKLQDGDLVQLIWNGPDMIVDTMDVVTGMTTGDDSLLTTWGIGAGIAGAGTGRFKVGLYAYVDHTKGYPAQGDRLYLRVFDDSTIGEDAGAVWYGESEIYQVQWDFGEEFYSFPDSNVDASIQVPWYRSITICGGFDSSMAEYPLAESSGIILEDGDLVELIYAGPDGVIDPMGEIDCLPTGDDNLLATMRVGAGCSPGTGLFKGEFQTFSGHKGGYPAQGDVIYLRIFNDYIHYGATHYGESNMYAVTYKQGETFFSFPDSADDAVVPNPCFGSTLVEWPEPTAGLPEEYLLRQNYPNPFNPVTEITYAIPRAAHVTLKVYNVLGHEVATLVDADREANFYMVCWDAGDLAGGVYFCRLRAGGFSRTIKMVFLK